MPNPYVVKVDRNAFWNQFRSTPEPALEMRRPPELIEPTLYRGRWPETGPYAGQSFYPFAFEPGALEPTPIQQPLPGDLPTAPSDVDIQGLGESDVSIWYLVAAASSAVATYHGFKRNSGSVGWAVAWGLGGWFLPIIVPAIAVAQGFAEPGSFNGLDGTPAEHEEEAEALRRKASDLPSGKKWDGYRHELEVRADQEDRWVNQATKARGYPLWRGNSVPVSKGAIR